MLCIGVLVLVDTDASDSKYQCRGLRPWSYDNTGLRPLPILVLVWVSLFWSCNM